MEKGARGCRGGASMMIHASTRPKGLKKGTTMKKFAKVLGFESEPGLHDLCGLIELSGEDVAEFQFLTVLWRALSPVRHSKTKISVEIDGKVVGSYTNAG